MMHLQSCDKYPPIKGREDAHMYVTLAWLSPLKLAIEATMKEAYAPEPQEFLALGRPLLKLETSA
jgi:hypothetical protein